MEHAMSKQPSASTTRPASVDRDDVIHVLGAIDEDLIIDTLALNPTFGDLEQAVIWAAGKAMSSPDRGIRSLGSLPTLSIFSAPTKKSLRDRDSAPAA
jgi:hypothetical protein